MYKSDCYNYDGLVTWLRNNLEKNLIPQNSISANSIALKFSRLYFNVTENDVMHAMEEIGFDFEIKKGERYYSVSFSEPATKAIWKTFD